MNWIQVVYFKLKEIDLYFPLLKPKKTGVFRMKANLSQNALKLASNDNYFT